MAPEDMPFDYDNNGIDEITVEALVGSSVSILITTIKLRASRAFAMLTFLQENLQLIRLLVIAAQTVEQ